MLKRIITAVGLCFVALIVVSATSHSPASAQSATVTPVPAVAGLTCQQIVSRALDVLQSTCDTLGRNNACYGNDSIKAELTSADFSFQHRGDKVPIKIIKTVSTSPLNQSAGTWGLSLLKLQANLPDTLPGQNVTFLVFGDTSIQNVSGDMSAFYFSTGLGAPTCNGVPYDSILVRSPGHTQVTFTANGVTVTIASTVTLKAVPHQAMTVQLIEGHATVSTPKGSRVLQPSQSVSISMGGATGLEAQGIPAPAISDPPDATTLQMVSSLDTLTGTKVSIPVDGCITAIDGTTVTIDGIPIQLKPTRLSSGQLQVGDCVTLNADFPSDGSQTFVAATIPHLTLSTFTNGGGNNVFGNSSSNGNGSSSNNSSNNSSVGKGTDKSKGGDQDKVKDKDKDSSDAGHGKD